MRFFLQMFKGNVSSTTKYEMSPEERAELAQRLKVEEAYFPNIIEMNDTAANLLRDSYCAGRLRRNEQRSTRYHWSKPTKYCELAKWGIKP